MNKYLISIATELDGHAGATTAYVQTEQSLTRSQFLLHLIRLFKSDSSEDVTFEEYPFSLERNASGQFDGEIVIPNKELDYEYRTPVSVLVTILPSRMTKDKFYIIESRTG